ncbi:tetratricopeptide repeat protein [Pyxidicoccus trucidator]|uniref:tetratricopeptide repeat protein n=1 Tax=Pyxidicoccus trucidator TaxID=2709662 RepID=UPI0013D959B8|nr:tetratricopeptide repeat protein [Pyxidicoccus trucidator]
MESVNFWGISARTLLLGLVLVLPGRAFAQRSAPAVLNTSAKEDALQDRLQTAARLYEELEYEQALDALAQTKTLAKTDDERAQVALYEGVVLADLGQRPRSLTAFREALSLKLDARLPVKVSPKVERDFEAVRAEVRTEREAQARAKAQPLQLPPPPMDRPTLPPTREPERVAAPNPTAPEPAPGVDLGVPSLNEQRTRRFRSLPTILLGAGVVAGGAGSYFGLRSQGNIQDARAASHTEDQLTRLDEARGQALAANILFGVAVTAAAGAVITWFTGGETVHEAEVSP